MFFSISKTADARFPLSQNCGHWVFNHDEGWHRSSDGWIKGYRYEQVNHGNYCKIQFDNQTVKLSHDLERSFPLWWDPISNTLSNITGVGDPVWADREVGLTADGLLEKKINIDPADTSPLSLDTATTMIMDNLSCKFDCLHADANPKKLFISGGLDTMILLSLAKSKSIPIEILDYEHFEYDHFLDFFYGHIKKVFWAYNQIHHWRHPCTLLTGACGDEFMFRGPSAIALWTAWHDIDFIDLLQNRKKTYHQHYFLLEKNQKIFQSCYKQKTEIQERFPTIESLGQYLIDRNLNDHQHWHLGNTLTWTPFKDIELFKIMLRLDPDVLLEHFVDATVSKRLISPDLLGYLSDNKNYLPREKLTLISQS